MKYDINDYDNFDKISIYATNSRSKDLIRSYEKLGWKLVSATSNNKYSNIMDLTFTRPHKIENKDKLQLLQVNMEIVYNHIGKLEKNKHSKTLIFSLSFLIFGLSLISFGIYFSIQNASIFLKILFSFLASIGAISILCSIFVSKRIFIKEKINFNKKINQLNLKLKSILSEIDDLKGVNNGNKT